MIIELIDAIRARVTGGAPPSARAVSPRSPARPQTVSIAGVVAGIVTAIVLGLGIVLFLVAMNTLDRAKTTLAAANNASDDAHRREVEQRNELDHIGRSFDAELTLLERLNATSAWQNTTARRGFLTAVRAADALEEQLRGDLAHTKQELVVLDSRRVRDAAPLSPSRVIVPGRVRLAFTAYARFNGTLSEPASSKSVTLPTRGDGSAVTLAIGMRNVGTAALLHPIVTAAAAYPATAFVQQFFRAGDPTHAKATELATGRSASDPYVLLIRVTPNGEKLLHVIVSASGTNEDGAPYVTTQAFQAIITESSSP